MGDTVWWLTPQKRLDEHRSVSCGDRMLREALFDQDSLREKCKLTGLPAGTSSYKNLGVFWSVLLGIAVPGAKGYFSGEMTDVS